MTEFIPNQPHFESEAEIIDPNPFKKTERPEVVEERFRQIQEETRNQFLTLAAYGGFTVFGILVYTAHNEMIREFIDKVF